MIAYLKGRLAALDTTSAIIEVDGVGYRLGMSTLSLASLGEVGSALTVYTSLIVREDSLTLYGFLSHLEQEMFERLLTVSGVGPKVALSALSSFPPETLQQLIVDEDVKRLSTISGLGKKTAQRIILELAGVLAQTSNADGGGGAGAGKGGQPTTAGAQAHEALLGMGFTAAEAELALRDYQGPADDTAALIRHALQRLGAKG